MKQFLLLLLSVVCVLPALVECEPSPPIRRSNLQNESRVRGGSGGFVPEYFPWQLGMKGKGNNKGKTKGKGKGKHKPKEGVMNNPKWMSRNNGKPKSGKDKDTAEQ
eukprot:CAMPEP_0116853558 /NCGR_PEP_ID=MMETSP0418-20121206/17988_1 /TAXON_ID=1158023 /ORGANISM="Astrosyne radiata, Strain 13vi08-1A" /LENGTH=105 /DNA_ID=CAMNT_0004485991 /DNA_START=147 /DNA_END=461 /DNA_ORIENTATION=-